MQDEITALIEEADTVIQSQLDSSTKEWTALDRMCEALKLLNAKVRRMDEPA